MCEWHVERGGNVRLARGAVSCQRSSFMSELAGVKLVGLLINHVSAHFGLDKCMNISWTFTDEE